MQENESPAFMTLSIYPVCYFTNNHCYYAGNNNMVTTKIRQNNVLLREPANQPELHSMLAIAFPTTKKIKVIFAEQILYLTMVSELTDYKQIHGRQSEVTRSEFEEMKERDIVTIYERLDELGYEKLQVMHFYLRMRKKSKLLNRYYDSIPFIGLDRCPAVFKISKTVEEYKSLITPQNILVLTKQQSIMEFLDIKSTFPVQYIFKVYIASNLDGVLLQVKFPLYLIDLTD